MHKNLKNSLNKNKCKPKDNSLQHRKNEYNSVESCVTATNCDDFFAKLSSLLSAPKETYSLEQASAYLHISVEAVKYYSTRVRELSYVPLSKGIIVFLKIDLDEFLQKKKVHGIVGK